MKILIYGAQAIALGACQVLQLHNNQDAVEGFLVTNAEGNPFTLAGLPVRDIALFADGLSAEEKSSYFIYIATPENVMDVIECTLQEYGFTQHERVTSMLWSAWMEEYFRNTSLHDVYGEWQPALLSVKACASQKATCNVIMTKFYKDAALTAIYEGPSYWKPLQVGAALCEERMADLTDDTGENISEKNGNYSELTGLYWLWKNLVDSGASNAEYFGLVHYRRILELTEDDFYRLHGGNVDVVLPYPMPYEGGIASHPKKYLKDADWQALLLALKELEPEYAKAFPEILKQRYMYNYNIILARRDIFNDYCGWLFPVLARVEELSIPRGSERRDRYIGYMGEILETLYFVYHRRELNIVHTGCRFLT